MLSSAEYQRYARQISLPEIGDAGQQRLARARVLIVGAGGLGSPCAMYLAAAGVGTVGLVDFDTVDPSNLHRQLLHGTRDVGRLKVESAAARLADLNPHVTVRPFAEPFTSANALALVRQFDIVVDGSDNFPTRYLTNDACVLSGVPCVYGSVERFDGQASVFATTDGPCYRCLFREPPPPGLVPTCAEAGVFGVLPGLIGVVQATEVIKLITGVGEPLVGRLLLVDARRMRFRTIDLRRDPACPVCGTREQTSLIDYEAFCGLTPAVSGEASDPSLEPAALARLLAGDQPPVLVDIREPWEQEIARLPNAVSVPMSAMTNGVDDVPADRDVVLYCHHGSRSAHLLAVLRSHGMRRVRHLRGGIDAWSVAVDPSVPRY